MMADGPGQRYADTVTAGPGGAMTDEVGVISGDVTVVTALGPDGRAVVRIQYLGADEWYTLTGSPAAVPPEGLRPLHDAVAEAVRRGGEAVVPGPGRR